MYYMMIRIPSQLTPLKYANNSGNFYNMANKINILTHQRYSLEKVLRDTPTILKYYFTITHDFVE